MSVPDRLPSSLLLLGAVVPLAFGPWIVRQDSMEPEPLLRFHTEELRRSYAQRRKRRARAILGFVIVGSFFNVLLAAAAGWGIEIDFLLAGVAAIVLLAVLALLYWVRDRAAARRIQEPGNLAGDGPKM